MYLVTGSDTMAARGVLRRPLTSATAALVATVLCLQHHAHDAQAEAANGVCIGPRRPHPGRPSWKPSFLHTGEPLVAALRAVPKLRRANAPLAADLFPPAAASESAAIKSDDDDGDADGRVAGTTWQPEAEGYTGRIKPFFFGADSSGLDSDEELSLLARHAVAGFGWQTGWNFTAGEGPEYGRGDSWQAAALASAQAYMDVHN
eukprot:SAG22_NODE_7701_length_716_cov_0.854133_1_plen_203_part_01